MPSAQTGSHLTLTRYLPPADSLGVTVARNKLRAPTRTPGMPRAPAHGQACNCAWVGCSCFCVCCKQCFQPPAGPAQRADCHAAHPRARFCCRGWSTHGWLGRLAAMRGDHGYGLCACIGGSDKATHVKPPVQRLTAARAMRSVSWVAKAAKCTHGLELATRSATLAFWGGELLVWLPTRPWNCNSVLWGFEPWNMLLGASWGDST